MLAIELHEQAFLGAGTREGQAFTLAQELFQVMVIDAHVDLGGEAHNAGPDAVSDAVDGRSPAIPMDEGGQAPGSKGRAKPADLADGSPEELGGLRHQQLAAVEGMENFQALFGLVPARRPRGPLPDLSALRRAIRVGGRPLSEEVIRLREERRY